MDNPIFGSFWTVIDGTSRAGLKTWTILADDAAAAIGVVERRGISGTFYAVPFTPPEDFTLVSKDIVKAIIAQVDNGQETAQAAA